jgi:hypothetical protein
MRFFAALGYCVMVAAVARAESGSATRQDSIEVLFHQKLSQDQEQQLSKLVQALGLEELRRGEHIDFVHYKTSQALHACESLRSLDFIESCTRLHEPKAQDPATHRDQPNPPAVSVAPVETIASPNAFQRNEEKVWSCPENNRKPHPKVGGRRTQFWAQEYTGATWAREQMSRVLADRALVPKAPQHSQTWVIDTTRGETASAPGQLGEPKHGDQVRALIFDPAAGAHPLPEPPNVRPPSQKSEVNFVDTNNVTLLGGLDWVAGQKPSVVNISLGMGSFPRSDSRGAVNQMQKVARKRNFMIAMAAGNEYPFIDPAYQSSDSHILYVGNMAASGYPSSMSSSGTAVFIHAPAGGPLDSGEASLFAKDHNFSGTSGAAPQVAGVVANIRALLPEATIDDIRWILQKTAIQTPASFSGRDGHGMLNAAKATAVAITVLKRCPPNSRRRESCITTEIRKPEHYESSLDKNFSAQLANAFPWCTSLIHGQPMAGHQNLSCPDLVQLLNKLQENAWLNPESGTYWGYLGCLHNLGGFYDNGDFYFGLKDRPNSEKMKNELLARAKWNPERMLGYERVSANPDSIRAELKNPGSPSFPLAIRHAAEHGMWTDVLKWAEDPELRQKLPFESWSTVVQVAAVRPGRRFVDFVRWIQFVREDERQRSLYEEAFRGVPTARDLESLSADQRDSFRDFLSRTFPEEHKRLFPSK